MDFLAGSAYTDSGDDYNATGNQMTEETQKMVQSMLTFGKYTQ
jgi:hypothetical protein